MVKKRQQALPVEQVQIQDAFWSPIQNLVMDVVIPYQVDVLEDRVPGAEKSHAIQNFRIAAGDSEGEFYGMVFQDSDVAKWLEAVAYSLSVRPDAELERKADEFIDLIGRAQEQDGYLNTFFSTKEPEHKWQNLQECHELYCSGHMIEAAVAYFQATGKDKFLNIMCRNADLICDKFGPRKQRGFPGHQEIELALLRLYRVRGDDKYLNLAKYFLEERGTEPDFFAQETQKRQWQHFKMDPENREYAQNHLPVRQQDTAVGHSVRAVYMYTAMADLASETNDRELFAACKKLWNNIVQKRMYITGGIGSTVHGEAFSADYELPNDTVYAETCASVAMVFFARRMLEIEPKGEYADILEKQLYNGVLSGMRLDGKRFFYVNPLEVVPDVSGTLAEYKHVLPERPEWYACACCPPNVARLFASLGQYAWGESDEGMFAHTYLGGKASFSCAGGVQVECESNYPWAGDVCYRVNPMGDRAKFSFAVHIPAWCKDWEIELNGQRLNAELRDGYVYIDRAWSAGDRIELALNIQPRRMYANAKVRADAGCVALMRGPMVYCFEEVDNGGSLAALRLPRASALRVKSSSHEPYGQMLIEVDGERTETDEQLYSENPPETQGVTLRAVPYYSWANRGAGAMRVWLLEK